MTSIIQCPSCDARYRLKFVIAEGQQVRCPSCRNVWRHHEAAADAAPEEEFSTTANTGRDDAADDHAAARAQPAAAPPAPQSSNTAFQDTGLRHAGDEPQDRYLRDGGHDWQGGEEAEEEEAGSAYPPGAETSEPYNRFGALEDGVGAASPGAEPARETAEDDNAPREQDWAAELANVISQNESYRAGGLESRSHADEDGARLGFDDDEPSYADGAYAPQDLPAERDRPETGGAAGASVYGEARDAAIRAEEAGDDVNSLDAFWRGPRNVTAFPDQDQEPAPQPKRGGGLAVAAAWGLYLAVMGGLASGVFAFRDQITEILPGSARYYASMGFPAEAQTPLEIRDLTYVWLTRDEKAVLEVRGAVVNVTGGAIAVPMLHISVRDQQDVEIAKTLALVTKQPLDAGLSANFTLEFTSPPKTLSEIRLQFGA